MINTEKIADLKRRAENKYLPASAVAKLNQMISELESKDTKPTKEVLATRLKIVQKMLAKKSSPTLKTRAKIIEKMLANPEKFCCGGSVEMKNDGGSIDGKKVDLFEYPELIPADVNEILEKYYEEYGDSMDYSDTARMRDEIEALGYTFDYYLDNTPYGLRKKGVELNELEGFEDMELGGAVKDGTGYVVVSIHPSGYWYVLTKPVTKEWAEENAYIFTRGLPKGEIGEIKSVKEVKAHKKIIGEEYLSWPEETKKTIEPIANNYEGKSPEQVWNSWNQKQRKHFLKDHNLSDFIAAHNVKYKSIADEIKQKLMEHIKEGQYSGGGIVIERIGDYFILPELDREKAKKNPYNVTNREGGIVHSAKTKEAAKKWAKSKYEKGGDIKYSEARKWWGNDLSINEQKKYAKKHLLNFEYDELMGTTSQYSTGIRSDKFITKIWEAEGKPKSKLKGLYK